MHKEQGGSKIDLTTITSMAAGAAIAMGLCLGVMAMCAWMIAEGKLGEIWASRAGLAGSFLGCFMGGGYAIRCIRSRALLVGLGIGVLYLLLWMLAGMVFPVVGGASGGLGLILSALIGGGLSGFLFAGGKKRRK